MILMHGIFPNLWFKRLSRFVISMFLAHDSTPNRNMRRSFQNLFKVHSPGKPLEVHWDGKQSRDFTYVANVVQANLLAAQKPKAAGEFFNIAYGKNYSLLDIVAILEKLSERKLEREHKPARSGDVRKTWADIGKAKRLLGYKPQVDLEEGLRLTWEWFSQA